MEVQIIDATNKKIWKKFETLIDGIMSKILIANIEPGRFEKPAARIGPSFGTFFQPKLKADLFGPTL